MTSPDSFSSISTTDSCEPSHQQQPELACIRFLKTHLQHGGVDEKGYNMLYRMINMMSAIGWEVHVTYSSKIPQEGSKANMERYGRCILQGCEVFSKNMALSINSALNAIESLPEIGSEHAALGESVEQWQQNLQSLHEPTGNDARLFKLVLGHYHDIAYARLVQLNARKPQYGLGNVLVIARSVYTALKQLSHLATQADVLVAGLDEKLERAEKCLTAVDRDALFLAPTIYQQQPEEESRRVSPNLSKSFSAAEEEFSRRGHARAATFSEADYTATSAGVNSINPKPVHMLHGAPILIRRKGINVPRIFTGSFSEFETEMRNLQLHKVQTPETDNIDGTVVRDFGNSPLTSPCMTPSPVTMLQRREALLSRDSEFQDRVINGEVVTSRRPSTKTRAHTVDDTAGGLDAWLNQEPTSVHPPGMPGPEMRRGANRQREHTL